MHKFSSHPAAIVTSIMQHRELILASVKRDVLSRYRGSILGVFWSFFTPVLMLLIYTFVFSQVFKAKWHEGATSNLEFAFVLFAGLIVFNLFSECITKAPNLVLNNPNFVKKVLYPLEILPIVSLLSAIYHALVSVAVWLVAYFFLVGTPHLTALLLPFVLMPFLFLILGLSWLLASLGVFFRDVSQFIGLLTTVLLFLSPIFYPLSALPKAYQELIFLNPIAPIVEMTRDVLYWGQFPKFNMFSLYFAITLSIAWLGFAWFQKTRKGFADVI